MFNKKKRICLEFFSLSEERQKSVCGEKGYFIIPPKNELSV